MADTPDDQHEDVAPEPDEPAVRCLNCGHRFGAWSECECHEPADPKLDYVHYSYVDGRKFVNGIAQPW